ncbi:hypothetical protein [Rubellicoccus peritrichatus]|uniref:Uncharacterized protein n=1 Tax=Rubellicoccus peritrichatus TaxID=3080537 RepID=A0AAQ3QWY9_9BACT|nr:hypothetical protein [Puniceicoccus sp. CR14]WOO43158.1 hypothetical protein RZN69_08635 [Puniceicoccus sp. CR14]
MISVETKENLGAFNKVLKEYGEKYPKRASEIIATKGKQLVLGNTNPKFGATFPGLYDVMRERAPKEGEITEERQNAIEQAQRGRFPIKIRDRVRKRSKQIMEGEESGVFKLDYYGRGGSRVRLTPVRTFQKGKRKGQRAKSKRAKTAKLLSGETTEKLGANEVVLNQLQVAAFLEMQARESGRGYAGAPFWRRRYRRIRPKSETHQRIGVVNKKGHTLAKVNFRPNAQGASFHLTATPPVLAEPWAQRRVNEVIADVHADTVTFLLRKEIDAIEKGFKRGVRRLR